jgi:Clostripain family
MTTPRIAMYVKAGRDLGTTEMCAQNLFKPIYNSQELKTVSPSPDIRFQCVRAEAADTVGRDDPALGTTRVKVGPDLWKDALRWKWSPAQKLVGIRKVGQAPIHRDMGTPEALAEFVNDSFAKPAERNILMLWGHGGASLVALEIVRLTTGAAGIAKLANLPYKPPVTKALKSKKIAAAPHLFQAVHDLVDATNQVLGSGPGKLSLGQVATGLENGLHGKWLDALLLCECQMASLEVAYEYREYARYLIGSEELLAAAQWPHAGWLSYCAANPGQPTPALMSELLRQFENLAKNAKGGLDTYTLSCIDMDQIDALAAKLDTLVTAFGNASDKEWRAALDARKGLREFGFLPAPVLTIDLISFLTELSRRLPKGAASVASANACLAAAKKAVAGNKAGQSSANGLSIYFPLSAADAAIADPKGTYWPQSGIAPRFSREHRWVKFLADFQTTARRLNYAF